jgi:uncharacterized protein with FMN-binding domain
VKRTPIVLGGTIAGLIGVLLFRTTPSQSSFATLPGASAASGPSASPAAAASASGAPVASASASGAPAASASASASGSASAKKASTTKSAGNSSKATGIRTATGAAVNYSWGILSVKVTVSGQKITNVAIASLDDGGNPRSQMIDQQSIPLLEQEAMQAQSANIQGVSGASYTSAGFQQSLQSALQTLGI